VGTHSSFKPATGEGLGAEAGAVELKTVKYTELIAAVKAERGKVLVVDVWAEY